MDIQNEIIQTIDLMIEKRLDDKNLPRMVQSVVVGSGKRGYICSINGSERTIPCVSGLTLTPGLSVWICIPNGEISKAFIVGTVKDAQSAAPTKSEALNYYDPNSSKPISGVGVATAFRDLKETVDLTFTDWGI